MKSTKTLRQKRKRKPTGIIGDLERFHAAQAAAIAGAYELVSRLLPYHCARCLTDTKTYAPAEILNIRSLCYWCHSQFKAGEAGGTPPVPYSAATILKRKPPRLTHKDKTP